MHTSKSEIQMPMTGRRRGRYKDEFKRQIVLACGEPGVSTAAIALANGLNANMVRRWVVESSQGSACQLAKLPTTLVPDRATPGFIAVKLAESLPVPQADNELSLTTTTTRCTKPMPACLPMALKALAKPCASWSTKHPALNVPNTCRPHLTSDLPNALTTPMATSPKQF